jgi:hypothetical protein
MNGTTVLAGNDTSRAIGTDWHIAGTGDFNGDHNADILWRRDNGEVSIWTMNGTTVLAGNDTSRPIGTDWHVATHHYDFT